MLKIQALVSQTHGNPLHNLCSHFIKHVTSRSSPASGCLRTDYQPPLFIIKILMASRICFLWLNPLIKQSVNIFLSISQPSASWHGATCVCACVCLCAVPVRMDHVQGSTVVSSHRISSLLWGLNHKQGGLCGVAHPRSISSSHHILLYSSLLPCSFVKWLFSFSLFIHSHLLTPQFTVLGSPHPPLFAGIISFPLPSSLSRSLHSLLLLLLLLRFLPLHLMTSAPQWPFE